MRDAGKCDARGEKATLDPLYRKTSPPQRLLQLGNGEKTGKRERKWEIEKSRARGGRWEGPKGLSPFLFFSLPNVPRALSFPLYPAPAGFTFPSPHSPAGKTKETSVEERVRKTQAKIRTVLQSDATLIHNDI